MAEPLGAVITLALSLRALRFQGTSRWPAEAGEMGAGAAALILTKEVIAARYRRMDWRRARILHDSMRADIRLPSNRSTR